MNSILRHICMGLILLFCVHTYAQSQYVGRVVDAQGRGIGYATVYPMDDPVSGTATNDEGVFRFQTGLPPTSMVVISFIGYEKQLLPLSALTDSVTIMLHEQPIALEEMVIAAKPAKQRNKRKQISELLHAVYVQMDKDFAHTPYQSHVVSDVRMDSEGEAWGMEQMIASIVNLPESGKDNKDSVQFSGEYCKRYFKQSIRDLADTIYKGESLERMDRNMRRAATAIDSGVVVHKGLWSIGNIQYDFEQAMNDTKHWSVSNESEGETVLTHTEKKNYLGIFKYQMSRHYIVDSKTLSVLRFSEQANIQINIPFGIKLNADQLQILNLLNMSDQEIEKFRLRKANAQIHLNTIYQRQDGHLYTLEKNLHTDASIIGARQMVIPVQVKATQRVTSLITTNVKPFTASQMTRRVKRQIVEIY
ncbi:MAG: carboxypeptidase-like regulatory domain-containing protein [Paludibacteraceae bacterium]|nr:carboxypeptidase-like regulatory domain-containing protein [Paludibacteraceae bacterium]